MREQKNRMRAFRPDVGANRTPALPVRKRPAFLQRVMDWMFVAEPICVQSRPVQNGQSPAVYSAPAVDVAAQTAEIRQALRAWQTSGKYFEGVSDPELIDYAVFQMEAAQKRYVYLLRSAKTAQTGQAQGISPDMDA